MMSQPSGLPDDSAARRLDALHNLTAAVLSAESPEGFYQQAVDSVVSALGANRASLLLFDGDGVMRFVAWRGLSETYREAVEGHTPWSPGDSDAAPILVPDALSDAGLVELRSVFEAEGVRALAFVPLVHADRVVGKFMLYFDEPHVFTADEIAVANILASQAAVAIDRRVAEEQLRTQHDHLQLALAAAQLGTWDWDISTGTVQWSTSLEAMHGLAPGTFPGTFEAFQADIHPEDKDSVLAVLRSALEGSDPSYEVDYRIVIPDGSQRWVTARGQVLRNEAGEPVRMLGVCSDNTERRHAQAERDRLLTEAARTLEALRASEARFRMLADNMSQLAWTCDQLGNVTWYNQRWLDYTGLEFEEMKGWGWEKVQHPDHVDRVVSRVQQSADTGEPWEDLFPLRRSDGEYRWFLSRALPIQDGQGNIVQWFGTNTDVTEQIVAEEKVAHQADQLRALNDRLEQLYTQQRDIALTLQESLLPALPTFEAGLEIAARYQAATVHAQIGGDWYDAIPRDDGSILLIVGDVSGHGIATAAQMAALRFAARAYAAEGYEPARILAKLDTLVDTQRDGRFATMLCMALHPEQRRLILATAGHPGPLLMDAQGVRYITARPDPPLGVPPTHRSQTTVVVEPSGTLVAFTDGLYERRGESIDIGLERVRVAACAGDSGSLDDLLEHILRFAPHAGHTDDIVILAARWHDDGQSTVT